MKLFLLCCILIFIIYGCSETNKQNIVEKEIKSNVIDSSRSISSILSIMDLPFGSDILVTYKFPKDWNNTDDADIKSKRHEKQFNEIQNTFNQLNIIKSIKSPVIKEIENIYLNDFKDSLLFSIDSIKYQLPDIGPYKCFYSFADVKRRHEEDVDYEKRSNELIETGNLILYDSRIQKAKIINIYNSIAGSFSGSGRWFYIDKSKELKIFEYNSDEERSEIKNTYKITIEQNGKLQITENK